MVILDVVGHHSLALLNLAVYMENPRGKMEQVPTLALTQVHLHQHMDTQQLTQIVVFPLSVADIVKMGRPQPKAFTPPVSSHQQSFEDYVYKAPEVHHEHDVSPDDDWPVIEQPPQPVGVQSFLEPYVESANADQSNVPYETSHQYLGSQTDEAQAEDENVYEDHTANHVLSRNMQEDTSGSAPLYDNEMLKIGIPSITRIKLLSTMKVLHARQIK